MHTMNIKSDETHKKTSNNIIFPMDALENITGQQGSNKLHQ